MVLKPSTCAVVDLWCLMISQLIFDIFFDEKNYVKIVGLLLHVPKITCISLGHIRYVHSKKIPSSKKSAHFFFFLLFSFNLFRFLVLLWIRYLLIRIKVRRMKIKSFTGVRLTSFFHEKIAVEMPAKLKWYSTWETSKRSQLIQVLTSSFLVYLYSQITLCHW